MPYHHRRWAAAESSDGARHELGRERVGAPIGQCDSGAGRAAVLTKAQTRASSRSAAVIGRFVEDLFAAGHQMNCFRRGDPIKEGEQLIEVETDSGVSCDSPGSILLGAAGDGAAVCWDRVAPHPPQNLFPAGFSAAQLEQRISAPSSYAPFSSLQILDYILYRKITDAGTAPERRRQTRFPVSAHPKNDSLTSQNPRHINAGSISPRRSDSAPFALNPTLE